MFMKTKEIIIGVVVFVLLSLAAGASITFVVNKFTGTDSDLDLKEKCSKYVEKAQKRIEDERESETNPTVLYTYAGTFYSKTKKTCISVTGYRVGKEVNYAIYYDELTGDIQEKDNSTFDYQMEKRNYEQSLNFVK